MPLALMFDEDYQSHAFYQSDKAMSAFEGAEALVFVGTSFQVNITNLALNEGPRKRGVPVFNFNLHHSLAKKASYEVHNIIGKAEETLQELVARVEGLMVTKKPRLLIPVEPNEKVVEEEEEEAENAAAASTSDPSHAFDTLPQPPLPTPLAEDAVAIDFQECYGRLPHPSMEADVDRIWTELAAQRQGDGCSALFNASKFRLAGVDARGDKLVLQTWLTDYKTARGTNYHPDVLRWMDQGRATHGDAGAYLSQKLGVSAVVCTTDGDLVLMKRSTKGVADFQGFYDTPGGHPEPSNVGLAFPPAASDTKDGEQAARLRRNVCHEIFHSAAQEVADEVGVPLDKLGPPLLLGIVRQLDSGCTPSAAFLIPCRCSTAEVRACYSAGPKEQDESTGLVFVPKTHLQDFLATTTLQLAPAARGSLGLYGAWDAKRAKEVHDPL